MKPRNSPILFLIVFSAILIGCGKTQKKEATRSSSDKPTIVSLAPSITEMIYAIGAERQLIGRTSACDWPADVKKVQVVGAFGQPSLEVITSLVPDLVIDIDLADENMGEKITALGIRRERLNIRSPEDIPAALRKLGELTDNREQADSLAFLIDDGLENFRNTIDTTAITPKVYLEIWDDPLWTGGKSSYVSALITYAGGENIGDAAEKEYFEVSPEWVIRQNPDIIACMYMSRESDVAADIASRPGWDHIQAVKRQKIYDDFDNSIFLRPGPRVLEGIEQLRRIIVAASKE
ncbi:cobalamin-binding protein [Prosthecochloris sp.]|uniref:cobalamin-binding protein n=1 Tax=Prosthecochloris sp. TaxID=290513 RepID=UPI0025E3F5D2|nr:cobalamin-binding protein [Prosthecochloris sp.]